MKDEGHDPATYRFDAISAESTPSKRSRRSESAAEPDSCTDMIVQDEAGEEDETEQQEGEEDKPTDEAEQPKPEETMDVDTTETVNRKREINEETEATEAKKPCIDKEDELNKAENNTDAEDSINLDLGEDELLNEEVCFYFFRVSITLPPIHSKVPNGFMMDVD